MLTPDKIIEIFVNVDDFCKEFGLAIKKHRIEANAYKVRNREHLFQTVRSLRY